MENDDMIRFDWKDLVFGLLGSTIFVVLLQVFTGI